MHYVVTLRVSVIALQSCDVMAAASVSRPGGAPTAEKSQLILKGNHFFFFFILSFCDAKKMNLPKLQSQSGSLFFMCSWRCTMLSVYSITWKNPPPMIHQLMKHPFSFLAASFF